MDHRGTLMPTTDDALSPTHVEHGPGFKKKCGTRLFVRGKIESAIFYHSNTDSGDNLLNIYFFILRKYGLNRTY